MVWLLFSCKFMKKRFYLFMPHYHSAWRKLVVPISNLEMTDKNQWNRTCERFYKHINISVPNGQTDTINIAAIPFAVVVQDISEKVDAPEHFKDQGRGPAVEDRYAIAWRAVTLFADKGRGSFINLYVFYYPRFI